MDAEEFFYEQVEPIRAGAWEMVIVDHERDWVEVNITDVRRFAWTKAGRAQRRKDANNRFSFWIQLPLAEDWEKTAKRVLGQGKKEIPPMPPEIFPGAKNTRTRRP